MDNREYQLGKWALVLRAFEGVIAFGKITVVAASIVGSIYLILAGLRPFIGQEASQIDAFARFVQSFHLGSLFGYVLAGLAGVAWLFERKGKQRAIAQKSIFQKRLEENDPNRSTSGLTAEGLTPTSNE